MTWQNILKRPMMPVGDGGKAPLSFTTAQDIAEFELNLKELANKLNAYDLDVEIVEGPFEGEIDARIRHIIADEHGLSKEVFSQSAKGSGKYIWRGLRMVTERPMGSGKINELREKFPEYHVTQTKRNVSQDAERMKQHPDATEYYFSPKQELIDRQQKKYPTRPKKYGKNRRTMIQYKRYLEEGEKYGVLNPDETVNRDKFKKHFIDRIKDTDTELSYYDGIDEALNQFIPENPYKQDVLGYGREENEIRWKKIKETKSKNEKLVLEQLSIIYEKQMIKLLDDEKTLNSLIGQFSGTAVSLDGLFSKYKQDVLSTLKNNITDAIIEARKDSSWTSKNKLKYLLSGRDRSRIKRRKLGTTRGRLTPIAKSWFNTILKNKQEKLPEELTEGANVSDVPLKDWFKKKPKKTKPADNTAGTKQTKLF